MLKEVYLKKTKTVDHQISEYLQISEVEMAKFGLFGVMQYYQAAFRILLILRLYVYSGHLLICTNKISEKQRWKNNILSSDTGQ